MLPAPRRVLAALLFAALLAGAPSIARAEDTALSDCTDRVVRVENGTATLINTVTQQAITTRVLGPNGSIVVSPFCCFFAVLIPGGSIEVINGANGTTAAHTSPVGLDARVEFAPDGCAVAIIQPNGSVLVVNLTTGMPGPAVPVGPNPRVTWGPGVCLYAIVNPDGSVTVVNGATGAIVTVSSPVSANVRVEFSADCCLYAIIQPGGSVLIYRANGQFVGSSGPVGNNVTVTFGPNCTYTITDPPTDVTRRSWGELKTRYR